MYENGADPLSNNLRLNEISIPIFLQFYCKINRNESEIVVEATYTTQLIRQNIEPKSWRKKPVNFPISIDFRISKVVTLA